MIGLVTRKSRSKATKWHNILLLVGSVSMPTRNVFVVVVVEKQGDGRCASEYSTVILVTVIWFL